MIADNIAKTDFIVDVLKRDLSNIYRAQFMIAKHNIRVEGKARKAKKRPGATLKVRSGRLLNSLENPDFIIQASGTHFIVSAKIMTYMRYLDMKRLGNWKIYNRQVWGILYNNSLRDIRYRYGKEIHDYVREDIERALLAHE
jgi:hypothetical protein